MSRASKGGLTVICTLVDDALVSKWSVACYRPNVSEGIREARKHAREMLVIMTAEMEEEADA